MHHVERAIDQSRTLKVLVFYYEPLLRHTFSKKMLLCRLMEYGKNQSEYLVGGHHPSKGMEPENGSRLKRRSRSKVLMESLMSMLTSCKPNVASKFHDL